jgi:toxin ParE1/3/4
MLNLLLTPRAEIDLEEIFKYTLETWSIDQAEKYQDELFDSMQSILQNNHIGTIYYHKEGNYRKLNSNRHLIFYRITEQHCVVIRILHERMDLKKQL